MAKAKKLTYSNTPVVVDYALKDGGGEIITDTYQRKLTAGTGIKLENNTISVDTNAVSSARIYGVTFKGNAVDGTRIDECYGVTNEMVGFGYAGETEKQYNWFDDKDPFRYDVIDLTMCDSSGNALVDKDTGEVITAPFTRRKNFYAKFTKRADDGETIEISTTPLDGYTPIYQKLDGSVPTYIYTSVYPYVTLNTASGTYYGAQKGQLALRSHNFQAAEHYTNSAWVKNESENVELQPLITMRKQAYDVYEVLFYIEMASRNSQRFFNAVYTSYGCSTTGENAIGASDAILSSNGTYTQTTPWSQDSTYSTSNQTYKYRGIEVIFNGFFLVIGDIYLDTANHIAKMAASRDELIAGYSSFSVDVDYIGVTDKREGNTVKHKTMTARHGIILTESTTNSNYSHYYCDSAWVNRYNTIEAYYLCGVSGWDFYGVGYVNSLYWGYVSVSYGSRPCLTSA